jgi:hypothetical protein
MSQLIFTESFEYSEMDQLKTWLQKIGRWVIVFYPNYIEVIPICAGNCVNYHEDYIHAKFPTLCINRHNDDIHELYNEPASSYMKHMIDALEIDYNYV